MTVTRISVGLALLTVTACTQIAAEAPVYAPPVTTATSVGYGSASAQYSTTALQQSRVAAPPQYLGAPQTASAPPQAAPLRQAMVVPAPEAETRALTTRERIATFGAPERPTTTGRQFRAIEVAELTSRPQGPFDAPASTSGSTQMAASKTDPFSIPTFSTGVPYYQGSTPPAIEYFIPHIPQEEPLWCWAAAAQQAIGWVNNNRAPSQCAIVALAHGIDVQQCCNDREGVCARTGEIPAIEILVERFGGQAYELATVPRDPKEIYNILRKGDTLLIRLRPAPHDQAVGIRHMIMVRGIEWLRLPNNQLQATLLYNDPLGAGERAVNFDEIEGFFEQALVISRN